MTLIDLGNYGLKAAFVLAVFSMAASIWGGLRRRADMILAGRNAAVSVFALVAAASASLIYLLMARDYRVEYVAGQVNNTLNGFYRFSAFWGGQEGSLLFWLLLLCVFSFAVIHQNRNRNAALVPYATATLMATAIFFLTILNFVTPPFDTLPNPPADGRGLNPLLQDWGMVIHPLALFLGYVGYVVPFAFCVGALASGKLDTDWITATRRWTLFAWFFNGSGVLLGGAWAYRELGWGGYWAWDPVENVSLLPWLTGTAFLHSVIIQEKRGMLKVWNVSLIIVTYALTIFGTFVVRSGIISSVHAFASSTFGWAFLAYLAIALAVSFGLLIWRLPLLRSEHEMESFFSREAGFLLNNVVLVGITFAVFWGTIFPVVSEAVKGIKVTVGPPFFNQVNVPIGLLLILLTGAGPLLAWRMTSAKQLRKSFVYPGVVAAGALAVLLVFGVSHVFALLAFSLSAFVVGTIWLEYHRGVSARVRHQGEGVWTTLRELTMRNKRRFGGYIVHLGMAVLFIGIAASSAYQQTGEVRLRPGESFALNGVRLRYEGLRESRTAQYTSAFARLAVYQEGRRLGEVEPEKRMYFTPPQPTTEAGIHRGLVSDIYAVFAEANEEGATFKFMINPLINWVWAGGIIFALGTLVCVLPERWGRRRRSPAAAVTALSLLLWGLTSASFAAPAPGNKPPAPPQSAPTAKDITGPTTTDASALRLTRNMLTVRLEKGFYEVMELLDFENTGEATIVPKDGAPTLRIILPRSSNIRNPDAQITAAPHGLDQNSLQMIGNQIASSEPIPPGQKLVVLVYRLADEFGGIMVEKPVAYGTENFAVLTEKDRVQFGMHTLTRLEPVRFQEREFDRFTGVIRPGTAVQFHFKAPDSTANPFLFYGAGGGVAILGAVAGLWMRRRRNRGLARRVEREELLRAIAGLDDRLALGEISQEDHRTQRSPRFARLRELSRQ